jgi:hypothetical protein
VEMPKFVSREASGAHRLPKCQRREKSYVKSRTIKLEEEHAHIRACCGHLRNYPETGFEEIGTQASLSTCLTSPNRTYRAQW